MYDYGKKVDENIQRSNLLTRGINYGGKEVYRNGLKWVIQFWNQFQKVTVQLFWHPGAKIINIFTAVSVDLGVNLK